MILGNGVRPQITLAGGFPDSIASCTSTSPRITSSNDFHLIPRISSAAVVTAVTNGGPARRPAAVGLRLNPAFGYKLCAEAATSSQGTAGPVRINSWNAGTSFAFRALAKASATSRTSTKMAGIPGSPVRRAESRRWLMLSISSGFFWKSEGPVTKLGWKVRTGKGGLVRGDPVGGGLVGEDLGALVLVRVARDAVV